MMKYVLKNAAFSFCMMAAFLFFSPPEGLLAQGHQPQRIVTTPTAGSLPARSYQLETHLFDGGGVTQRLLIGVTGHVDIGVSYSGANIIGSRALDWAPHVGAQLRIRIIEETFGTPGISLGYDSQGDGPFFEGENLNRFRTKSRGAYLAVSRNYQLLGNLGLHGGVNYSFEDDDGDRDPSFWAGLDKSVTSNVDICAEYDFATNDNENKDITANRGWMNISLKLHLSGSFTLELDIQNILRNAKRDLSGISEEKPEPARELRLYYTSHF
jgi:hypothetical protein